MSEKNKSPKSFEEQVALAAAELERQFDEHLTAREKIGEYEVLILRDTEVMPTIIENEDVDYPFLNREDLNVAIAVLNGAIFELETKLRTRGFKPAPTQGVVVSMVYRVISGYWYRQDQHWHSLRPLITFDFVRDENK